MARFDLTDFEWSVIQPLLPQKSRGVPRVDDRAPGAERDFLAAQNGRAMGRYSDALWAAHHLCEPVQQVAEGGHLGDAS